MNCIVSLVGLSPVPNYVSIMNYIDIKKKNTIFLVYTGKTEKSESSLEVAKALSSTIQKKNENIKIEFIESDKSNFKKIYMAVETLENKILKFKTNEDLRILLDITGSTKANSAIFNYELNKTFSKRAGYKFSISYLDNFQKNIQEFTINDSNTKRIYNLKDIKKQINLSTRDILFLYNYDKYKDMFSLNGIDLFLDGFNLLFYKKSTMVKIKDKKEEIFELFNIAEKLGGRFTKIVYQAENFDDDSIKDDRDGMQHFLQKFENEANSSYADRLILKSIKGDKYLKLEKGKYTNECEDIKVIIGELN